MNSLISSASRWILDWKDEETPLAHSPEIRRILPTYSIWASHLACCKCWSHFTLHMEGVSPAFFCRDNFSKARIIVGEKSPYAFVTLGKFATHKASADALSCKMRLLQPCIGTDAPTLGIHWSWLYNRLPIAGSGHYLLANIFMVKLISPLQIWSSGLLQLINIALHEDVFHLCWFWVLNTPKYTAFFLSPPWPMALLPSDQVPAANVLT